MAIKFRAWDKKKKRWATDYDTVYITEDGSPNIYNTNSYTAFMQGADFEILLFTGYKDRNEKEIYEGDIISSPNGQIKRALIYFSQATFWYKEWDEMYEEWHHSEMGWCEQYGSKEIGILHWSANRIALEVIGNVYEHPELMAGRHEA